MGPPGGYLLDLDGTLYQGGAAVPGAVDALVACAAGVPPFRLVTNTTTRSRAMLVERLSCYGFAVRAEEIFTATLAGVEILEGAGYRVIAPFVPAGALEEMAGRPLTGGTSGISRRRRRRRRRRRSGRSVDLRAASGGVRGAARGRVAGRALPRSFLAGRRVSHARRRSVRGGAGVRQRQAGGSRRQAEPGLLRRGGREPRCASRVGRDGG